jgi:hypothetical protein
MQSNSFARPTAPASIALAPAISALPPAIIGLPPAGLPSVPAAAYIGVSRKTLSNWRALGEGPPYVRLGKPGGRVVYRVADLDRYLADRVIGGAR